MEIQEIWKDIVGYEGLYKVSNYGNILSLNYRKTKNSKLLIPGTTNVGYKKVDLSSNGFTRTISIHRLVALAFICNNENKDEVNHIDGVKSNNYTYNLEWCTSSENKIHSCRILGNKVGEKHHRYGKRLGDSPMAISVIKYSKEGNELERYTSVKGASIANATNTGHISAACKGIRKTAGGFKWSYS